ncbi:hypothetical protein H105_03109 [Trichophyton soudanense CBS 452.61]|uniref:Decapping enzyme Dcp1 n=2 Tax=Trichophyton TaxID=5550 RepID=A0A178FNM1_TRIVO|nr:hypothetical protein H105_03109 [Trichophyton soudanense CBS 452.61]EZG07654.1 hypothetical protein H106_02938 [Trichophyton rubrum CBS 735.88]OAL73077.1 hypothetical protein A7D00_2850 [Trichophyton violaceum]
MLQYTATPVEAAPAPAAGPAPPTRTNAEINLSVLRRHNPSISSILSLAQYAVIYHFNATTQLWEKIGVEGTLFVCQLTPGELGEDRYSVFLLNRRGMNNFDVKLSTGDDIEITEDYVILKVDEQDDSAPQTPEKGAVMTSPGIKAMIYGIWIFSEPPPSSTADARTLNAQVIKECAVYAGESRKAAEERLAAERRQAAAQGSYYPSDTGDGEDLQGGIPMGRQISLKELFGQQRAQDDEWSVKVHSPGAENEGPQHTSFPLPPHQPAPPLPQQHGGWNQTMPFPSGGNNVLGELFRSASMNYQRGNNS